ncbi:hypothetical protein IIA28_11935 [candidate division KSB1 bacterium]|nr:hypothetical protein [candidate division KSB1 bacterium]
MAKFSNHLIFLLSVFFTIMGQLLLKKGTLIQGNISLDLQQFWVTVWKILTNPYLVSWVLFAGASAFLWIIVVSKFDLSFIFPVSLSLTYVLIALGSWWWFGESLPPARIVGISVMCVGIFLVYKS